MKIEIGGIKIEKNGVTIELTADEARELNRKLNKTFGAHFDFGSFGSQIKTNSEGHFTHFTYEETKPAGGE